VALKSIRRRQFRNNAGIFARVLRLPGVEAYLRRAFDFDPKVDFSRERRRNFRNSAELYASILLLPGVEAYLRRKFHFDPEAELSLEAYCDLANAAGLITFAYRLLDETELPFYIERQTRH
jgi:hypothetical protein